MTSPFLRRFLLAGTVLTSVLLSSCSSIQLAYNQLDFLLKWRITDYFDFSNEQENIYDQSIPAVLKKHRQEELPKALVKMRTLRMKLSKPLSPDDGLLVVKDIKSFSRDTVNLLVTDASAIIAVMTPAQITSLELAFTKSNKKFQADFLKGTPEERFEKRFEKIIERTESFAGDLQKSQKIALSEVAKEHLLDMDAVYQNRLLKQQLILKTFKKIIQDQLTPSQTKVIVEQLLIELEFGSTPEQKEFEKKRDLNSGIILAKITAILDDQQRKKAQDKIRKWESDVQALIQYKTKNTALN